MFALSWQLTLFSLILLPFFVWLTRRVGNERRRIQSVRQGRLADMSTLVEESLSVSGILLGKTMGRSQELVDRFSGESSELADLEVRARMAGAGAWPRCRWPSRSCPRRSTGSRATTSLTATT